MKYDVCVITTIHGDFDNRIYQRQLSALADDGLRVCMIAPWDFRRRTRTDYDYVATKPSGNRLSRVRHGWRTFRAAMSVDANVYIFHDPDFLIFGALIKLLRGRAVVYDCHENTPEEIQYGKEWIAPVLRRPTSALFRGFENAVVRYLGKAIVAVPHLIRRFGRLGADVVLVRNFPRFTVPDGFANERAILYTGELTADYGGRDLLDMARELKRRGCPVPLRIVDRFRRDESIGDEFRRAIREEGLAVEILDPVPAERMPEILKRGCIGLSPIRNLPHKAIALPTKIFEFFLFGLVVVASDIDGTREMLKDGELGVLLPAEEPGLWAETIMRLLEDEALAESYRTRAAAAVQEEYAWAGEERRLVSYVGGLVEGAAARCKV